jgi:methionyl-tRNA formyltransferase
MVEVLDVLPRLQPIPQPDEGVTYAAKITKEEARLDFSQPASAVERQVRAFNPQPGAFFEMGGERIKLLSAEISDDPVSAAPGTVLDDRLAIACGEGAIVPGLVQRAGRGVMAAAELLRGFAIPPGTPLG